MFRLPNKGKIAIKEKPYIIKLPVLENVGLQWKKGRSETTSLSKRMIWETRCKCYRAVKSKIIYGDLPVTYYAMIHRNGIWDVLSKHRKKHTAQKACENHAKKNGLM